MEDHVTRQLLELNHVFYSRFGPAFAATRRRIQEGVRRVLDGLPDEGHWLDLGCGSGALALAWLARGRRSHYLGVDSSRELLAEAAQAVQAWRESHPGTGADRVAFAQADLGEPGWAQRLAGGPFQGALSFAVLHHIPGAANRLDLLRRVRALLIPGGCFIHSEWQFQHSPRLMERRQPWASVGLSEADLEPGDTLLDWRFALPGQAEQVGLRYVHLFTREELDGLARDAGFEVVESFEADGQGGRLGLYQVWRAIAPVESA